MVSESSHCESLLLLAQNPIETVAIVKKFITKAIPPNKESSNREAVMEQIDHKTCNKKIPFHSPKQPPPLL